MNRHKSNRLFAILSGILIGGMLSGCSNGIPKIEKAEQSGIYLSEEGKVTVFLVESFEKEYYDAAELEQMILTELEEYNTIAGGTETAQAELVDILSPDEKTATVSGDEPDTVTVQMRYASTADYTAFNESVLFFGTVARAAEAGYVIKTDLNSVTGDEVLKKTDASAMSDNHILLFEESIAVHLPYEVLYISDGVTVDGKKTVWKEADGRIAAVIMK